MRSQTRRNLFLATILIGLVLPRTVDADDKPAKRTLDLTESAAAATVERIVDQAVVNIGRRYNLNDKQLDRTGQIMKSKVNEFLKEHEEEIWPAIRELLASNLQPPESVEDLKRLGKAARKLAKLAHKAVKDGNAEWRKILTDDQKKTHDYDLAELDKTFAQMDQNFGAWEDGRSTDNPIFGSNRPRLAGGRNGPPRPEKPPDKRLGGKSTVFELTVFDTFVEGFIKDYELDAAQIDSARSILKEFKANARAFRTANEKAFAKIEKERNEAIAANDVKKRGEADEKRKKLIDPIYRLFEEMEGRLKGLLTTVQVERYAAKTQGNKNKPPKTVVKKRPAPKQDPVKKTASEPTEPESTESKPNKANS